MITPDWVAEIRPVSAELDDALRSKIDLKTKPVGALGRLESLAFQVGRIQQTTEPELRHPHLWVFAGDHGVVGQGVSAYPQEVTWQMVLNFLSGGAAINVFARHNGIRLQVVDVGVCHTFEARPDLVRAKVQPGTGDFTKGVAMSPDACEAALSVGAHCTDEAVGEGSNALLFGEMGIGNTTSAAALSARLLSLPVGKVVGRGTGLDEAGLARKRDVVERALALHAQANRPLDVLAALGGLEIAAMVGAMLRAAWHQCVFVVDGFIATAAFVVAQALTPSVRDYAVFAHQSDEQGHQAVLAALDVQPLLSLGMRLGEGTGAALAWPLMTAAVAFLNEMASFDQAGVSNKHE
ncbi:MAG: nicotinate-nucleotide--dimethylbenzimidazole phosphoribosyltransferase [Gammaproteobacteria bacterium]|nr:MAG: nicotinate-nucleotide--dimethylbenzimidazole phosphoribosyltransferase [Gammaproteobacteria bacterium]